MTPDDLTRKGIEALKAGDKAQARQLLTEAVENAPQHQIALLWLATVVDDPSEKRRYLEQAVQANPNNEAGQRAAAGLSQIAAQDEAAAPTQIINPPSASSSSAPSGPSLSKQSPPDTSPPADQQQQPPPPSPFAIPSSSSEPQGAAQQGSPPSPFAPQSDQQQPPPPSPFGIPSSSSEPQGSAQQGSQPSPFAPQSDQQQQPSPFQSGVPSPSGSQGAGQPGGFDVPSGSPPPPAKSSSNTKLIIGIISAVILLPCLCIGGAFAFLFIMGEEVDAPMSTSSQGTISEGQQVEGAIYDIFDVDEWRFEGEAGQRVTIRCNAAPGEDTDPRVRLIGPNGSEIDSDDDGGSGYNAFLETTLPRDGTYTIEVDVFSEGEYILSLE